MSMLSAVPPRTGECRFVRAGSVLAGLADLTPGQAADNPRFVQVLERIKVRGPSGRPRA